MSAEPKQQQQEQPVQVALRICPLSQRQKDANSKIIIRAQDGKKALIKDPKTGEEKEFSFDHAFESPDVAGEATATAEQPRPQGQQQKQIFDEVVAPSMKDVFEGRNLLISTYGMSNAGGTYTVLGHGSGDQAGILPRIAKRILDSIAAEDNKKSASSLSLQVVELTQEHIHDLLDPCKNWQSADGLKPKLTKDGYVVDSISKNIEKVEDVEEALEFADKNYTVSNSIRPNIASRASFIYWLNYKRVTKESENEKGDATTTSVSSRIVVVDLAGSEVLTTYGDIMEQNNTLSLAALGKCMQALAALGQCMQALSKKSTGEEDKEQKEGSAATRIPFRASKLTTLLMTLLKNGKMIMIGKVSPVAACYNETLATLRFLELVKTVKLKSKINTTTTAITSAAVDNSSSPPNNDDDHE